MGEEAAARCACEGDAAEAVALEAAGRVDAVDFAEAAVDVGEVAVEHVEDAAVFADDFVEEEAGLFEHGVAEGWAPAFEDGFVGLVGGEAAELEPLDAEVFDERGGARVFEHAADGFHEAEDGIDGCAIRGGEVADGKERAIDVVVAVDEEEFHA